MRIFVQGDRLLGECVVESPANPLDLQIVEAELLPAPMKHCRYVSGSVIVDPEYDQEREAALREIVKLERDNPITHRMMRELWRRVSEQVPEIADDPVLVDIVALDEAIKELRDAATKEKSKR